MPFNHAVCCIPHALYLPQVQAVSFNYARIERTFFDEALKKDFELLEAKGPRDAEA